MLLYPQGWPVSQLTYQASLRLPEGWKFGTALPIDEAVRFDDRVCAGFA